jgi:hypothetical protein
MSGGKHFMTPSDHRREAARLRREHPDDPEAQGSARAHMQIARALELARMPGVSFWLWWCFLVAACVFYLIWFTPSE